MDSKDSVHSENISLHQKKNKVGKKNILKNSTNQVRKRPTLIEKQATGKNRMFIGKEI